MPAKENSRNNRRTQQRAHSRKAAYLTKRILVRAARAGVIDATESTLQAMSYNVIAYKGRVVKKFVDGSLEDLGPIAHTRTTNNRVLLD